MERGQESAESLEQRLATVRARLGRKAKAQAEQTARAARFGWHGCLISRGWQAQLLANMALMRSLPGGQVCAAFVLVDLGCQGVKGAHVAAGLSREQLASTLSQVLVEPEPASPALCAAIIQRGVQWGARWGFYPEQEYIIAAPMWARVDPGPALAQVRCGDEQGRPVYIESPGDDVAAMVAHLERVASGGFVHVGPEGKIRTR